MTSKTIVATQPVYATKNMLCQMEWTHRIQIRELHNERKSKSFIIASRGVSTKQIHDEVKQFVTVHLKTILPDDIMFDNKKKSPTHIIIVCPRYVTSTDPSCSVYVSYPHTFLHRIAEEISKFLCRGKVAFKSNTRT